MIFIPYSTESVITKWPLGNIAIIAMCTLVFALMLTGVMSEEAIDLLVLDGWSPIGLIGYQFVHAGFFHFLGNMFCLWVFGNGVCQTMGNWRYVVMFLATGVLAGVVHNVFDGGQAVGASGAINGVIGFYLVLYPTNKISCLYWVLIRAGTVEVTGFWLILLWFILDAWSALSGSSVGVAYWAHVGGLLAGVGLGVLFERKGWAQLASYDNPSLVTLLFRKQERARVSRPIKTKSDLIREYRERQAEAERASLQQKQGSSPAEVAAADAYVNVPCPHCETNLEIPVEMAGATITCPSCGGSIALE